VGCSWDVGQGRFANQDYRAVRDWGFRVVLIGLRWSTPLLIILADTMVRVRVRVRVRVSP